MTRRRCIFLAVAFAACLRAFAHGGAGDHSHDAPDLAALPVPMGASPSLSGHGNHFDFTIAYRAFHADETVQLDLFLADWHTNEPITGSTIELTMTGAEFRAVLPVRETEEPGRYEATIEKVGSDSYSFLADISHNGVTDLISMTGFRADTHASNDAAQSAPFNFAEYGLYFLAAVAVVAALIGFSIGLSVRGRKSKPTEEKQ